MPEAEIKKRGGASRFRTIHPKGRPDVYMHVAVTKKKGPRGGNTVAGEPHHMKKHGGPAHGGYPHHSPAKPL